ncbi:hypothetical protein EVAR_89691_1 [Eumeta japonica]|uniref:Uncharacterized protein n=1 Tax=Eumeta variegata TaxID=151549 RepID=A0A4C1X0M3_EUMVA|nr:hypothetical protein EVAR_89691_1 [Eumeta japonica]
MKEIYTESTTGIRIEIEISRILISSWDDIKDEGIHFMSTRTEARSRTAAKLAVERKWAASSGEITHSHRVAASAVVFRSVEFTNVKTLPAASSRDVQLLYCYQKNRSSEPAALPPAGVKPKYPLGY